MQYVKKVDHQFSINHELISNLVLDILYPKIDLIQKLAIHEENCIEMSNMLLTVSRDTNNGFTFKGENLKYYFNNWDNILTKVESVVGPVKYKYPHIVIHFGDIQIHKDRRAYSLNIGLVNSNDYEVCVYDESKTQIISKITYLPGEAIILKAHSNHAVIHKIKPTVRAFLVFTPENNIERLFTQ